ncbi:O-antigen/teichoic acid export membrane protein [Limnobacter thiooxidans]|uniref:Lipopolysaccharide biosynthesis protein n=1 Tax=Limnobacter thiooxidans TaxID=131080 RepID=A0AA86J5P8_9BURK|nr:O-antigen/teichoic acid export membrane protein [Limnobacter thiooxidans]BET24765.1 lipopolysaccharide biosynthesis protein [Limnobacter thiooxidans]
MNNKTGKNKFLRLFAVGFGSSLMMAVLGYLVVLFNTKTFGLGLFGKMVLVQALFEMINKIMSFQSWQVIIKFGNEYEHNKAKFSVLLRVFLLTDWITSIISAVFSVLILNLVLEKIDLDVKDYSWVYICLIITVFSAKGVFEGYMRLQERFVLANGLQIIQVGATAIIAICAYYFDLSLEEYFKFVLLNVFLMYLIYVKIIIKDLIGKDNGVSGDLTVKELKEWYKFSIGGTYNSTVGAIKQKGETIIVGMMFGSSYAGLYAVAYRIAAMGNKVVESARQAIYPMIAVKIKQKDEHRMIESLLKATYVTLGLGALILVLSIFSIELIMVSLFGEEFLSASTMTIVLTAAMLVNLASFYMNSFVQLKYGSAAIIKATTVGLVLYLLTGIVMPYLLGEKWIGVGSLFFSLTIVYMGIRQIIRGRK